MTGIPPTTPFAMSTTAWSERQHGRFVGENDRQRAAHMPPDQIDQVMDSFDNGSITLGGLPPLDEKPFGLTRDALLGLDSTQGPMGADEVARMAGIPEHEQQFGGKVEDYMKENPGATVQDALEHIAANPDGDYSASDVKMANHLLEKGGEFQYVADVDGDGIVDIRSMTVEPAEGEGVEDGLEVSFSDDLGRDGLGTQDADGNNKDDTHHSQ
jgi:hypothetical protein